MRRPIIKVPHRIMRRRNQVISKLLMVKFYRIKPLMLIKSINIFCAKSNIKFYYIYVGELVGSYAFLEKTIKVKACQKVNILLRGFNYK